MESQPAQPVANMAVPPSPGFLRRGLARLVFGILGLVIFVVLLLALGLALLKSSRSQPPSIDAYSNATVVSQHSDGNSDEVIYSTNDKLDLVGDFYARRLGSSQESGCKKIYLDEKPSEEPGRSLYRCVVDTSLLEMQQVTTVTISYKNGHTQIDIVRSWGAPK